MDFRDAWRIVHGPIEDTVEAYIEESASPMPTEDAPWGSFSDAKDLYIMPASELALHDTTCMVTYGHVIIDISNTTALEIDELL